MNHADKVIMSEKMTDLEIIQDPYTWPYWPMLTLRMGPWTNLRKFGVLIETSTGYAFFENVLLGDKAGFEQTPPTVWTFDQVSELLAQGWVVS